MRVNNIKVFCNAIGKYCNALEIFRGAAFCRQGYIIDTLIVMML